MDWIENYLQDRLMLYKSSIGDDEMLLKSGEITDNQRNILLVTLGERRCLGKLIQACTRIQDLLKLSP